MDSNRINITICGDGGCGKSSITIRLVRSQWTHEYDPTIEDSYSVTRAVDGRPYLLALTDTAGQEEYRALQSSYSRHADAFLLVYDITAPPSLYQQLPYFLDLIRMEAEARHDAGRMLPVCIVAGNKCDLKEERRVSAREGLEWARGHGCGFMETSARECVNVEETFALLVRRVLEARRQHAQPRTNPAPTSALAQPRRTPRAPAHEPGDSFSRTQPLAPPPLNEKSRGSGAERRGLGTDDRERGRVRSWLHRLRCW